MPLKRTQTLFVILARPQPHARSDTQYIANDGSTTPIRSYAARFWTFWEAKAFAAEHQITLNALTYIGREDFTDLEMCG
jgi:carotenoid cleavage dioxygenase-like enzyme